MQVLIPAAGKGTRLRPHTYAIPKSLLPIAGKPLLHHIIDPLRHLPISRYLLVTGYLGDAIQENLSHTYPELPFHFIEQSQQHGLGHSVWTAKSAIQPDEPLLIILGDTIVDMDWQLFQHADTALLGVQHVEDPRRFGVVKLRDDGSIAYVVEKPENPPSSLAIVGIYYFTHPQKLLECLDTLIEQDIRTRGEYQLTDALQLLLERGETIRTFTVTEWYDCGNLAMWLETNKILLEKRGRQQLPTHLHNVRITPPVLIADSATIADSAIGPYVTIGENAQIRHSTLQNVIVGNDAIIEHATLTNSVVGDRASIRAVEGTVSLAPDSIVRNDVERKSAETP